MASSKMPEEVGLNGMFENMIRGIVTNIGATSAAAVVADKILDAVDRHADRLSTVAYQLGLLIIILRILSIIENVLTLAWTP